MKILVGLLFLALSFSQSTFSQNALGNVRGNLFKEGSQFFLKSDINGKKITRKILFSKSFKPFKYTLDERMVNSPNYILEFRGEVSDKQIKIVQTPTIVGGVNDISGIFSHVEGEHYLIGDMPAQFGRTKPVYGIPFDKESKHSYVGKEILAQGKIKIIKGERTFIIDAIIEDGLLTAGKTKYPAPREFDAAPLNFLLKSMPQNVWSQEKRPFRGILSEDKGYTPKAGESFLVITLSGRQGDAPGSAGGHFAIGMGEVQKDLSLKGEIFNFYFKGEKEVLAGNTDLRSYFGHLIQGQQNYRPTYTLFAYGVKKKDLKKLRDDYEKQLHRVRTEKGLEISGGYNCTTTSNNALQKININGKHANFGDKVFDIQNFAKINPFSWNDGTSKSIPKVLSFVLSTDPEYYLPRAAFESLAKNLVSKSWSKKRSIKRVDYVFIPQTPSRRQLGGMSYDSALTEGRKTIQFDRERMKNKDEIKKAQEILFHGKSKFSVKDIKWAKDYMNKDQAAVKEVLDQID